MKHILENIMISNKKILVVGDIILDCYVLGKVKKIAQEAPVPVFLKYDDCYKLGGAGNVFYNIHSLGITADLMGAVGKDIYGDKVLEIINNLNGKNDYIFRNNTITTVKKRFLCDKKQEIFRVDIEANNISDIDNNDIISTFKSIVKNYSIIVFSDYDKGFLTKELITNMLKISKEYGIKTIIDPKSSSFEKYNYGYLIKPNINEFCEMYGKTISINEIMHDSQKILEDISLNRLLITCDKDGVLFLRKNQKILRYKPINKMINNVSGAGDVFLAVFAVCLSCGIKEATCTEIANICASSSIEGPFTCNIDFNKIKNFLSFDEKYIYSIKQLKSIKKYYKNKKIVFTNGCFDLLHIGHLTLIKEAKKLGDVLVIGINSDESVKNIKGKHRPIIPLEQRMKQLASFSDADWIIPFNEDDPLKIIEELNPDILVKGNEYSNKTIIGSEYINKNGGNIVLLPMIPDVSTTQIIRGEN